MTPGAGILTQLLNDFRNVFVAGLGNIQGDANWLLGSLIIIDLVLAILLNIDDGDHLKTLVQKILTYGFFIYLVVNYRSLANVILRSFATIGLKAGGYGISLSMLSDPSKLSEFGMYVAQPIFNHVSSYSGMSAITNLGDILESLFIGFLIIACFFVIGIQIFLTYLEFYIVGCIALILLPWGVNKHTAFIGEKAIGAVFAFGIKLMVLSFIASVAVPLCSKWVLPHDPTLEMMLYTLLGSLAIAFLSFKVPELAASLLSGSPSFSAGMAAGAAMAGVGAMAATRAAIGNTIGGGMRRAGSMVQAAQMGRNAGQGAMRGIANLAAANSSFGQGQKDAHRSMSHHGMAMRSAGMKGRLKNEKAS